MTKIRVRRTTLLYHLEVVNRAVAAKGALSGVKLDCVGEGITLEATNNDINIVSSVENVAVSGDEKTSILVNGALLLSIIKKIDDEFVEIEITDKVKITGGKSRFTLGLLNVKEFPERKAWQEKAHFTLVGLDFKNLVRKSIMATSVSQYRQALLGVNFKVTDNEIITYASDSFRIASAKIVTEHSLANEPVDIIIPASSLQELIKVMRDDLVHIYFNNDKAKFVFGSTEFETRLINAEFPDVEKLFPNSFLIIKTVNRHKLILALERAGVILDNNLSPVVKIDFEQDLATITAAHNEVGQAKETVDTTDNKDNISIAMSIKYLLEALKTFDCNEVEIKINGETTPLVITDKKQEETTRQLILPVRV